MTDGVAQILGRPVRALLSANHVDPDVGVKTFLLGPVNPVDGNGSGSLKRFSTSPQPLQVVVADVHQGGRTYGVAMPSAILITAQS